MLCFQSHIHRQQLAVGCLKIETTLGTRGMQLGFSRYYVTFHLLITSSINTGNGNSHKL